MGDHRAVITLSADGSPGRNSLHGKDGSNGLLSGARGKSGGDATPAQAGTNASSLSVQIQQSQSHANGTSMIQVVDSSSLPLHELSVDEDIILSALGGDGGDGANGGNGGNGARGSWGRVRVKLDYVTSFHIVLCWLLFSSIPFVLF
jgi:hypothetical protein